MSNYLDNAINSIHPKPVLDIDDLYGKAKKAYTIVLESNDSYVDKRKLKWAFRYLKEHKFELISNEKAEELQKEYEEQLAISKKMAKVVLDKFPMLSFVANYFL
jgi:hypothetical protein